KEVIDKYKEVSQHNFKKVMEIILEILDGRKEISLEEIIQYVDLNNEKILEERSFYDFWMIMHQKSPIIIEKDVEKHSGLIKDATILLIGKYRRIEVKELNTILDVNDRFKVNNMILKLEGDNSGI